MRRRRFVRRTVALIVVIGSLGTGAVIARAHDQRLDDAMVALQKAQGLLEASQSGSPSPKVDDKFQRHIERAINLIGRVMDQIQDAADVADNL